MVITQEPLVTTNNTGEGTTRESSGAGTALFARQKGSDSVPMTTDQQADKNRVTPDATALPDASGGNELDIKDVMAQVMQSLGGAIAPQQSTAPRPSKWLNDPVVQAVNNAFTLGWTIMELRSRLLIARDLVHAGLTAAHEQEFGTPLQFTSVWRALFTRIATLQMAAFSDASTRDTFYQPADGWFSLLPYLNQQSGSTARMTPYFDIGLPATTYPCLSPDGAMRAFGSFSLYEVTRRALNCVGLLHVKEDPSEPLLSDSLRSYTDPLLRSLGMPPEPDDDQDTRERRRITAIDQVTTHIVQLLDAWDGFLRENYYSGGVIKNDVTEQTAYGAGSALAALSWNLAWETATMRCKNPPEIDQLYAKWGEAFSATIIVRTQHQLTALSTVLDDAYYRITGTTKPVPSDGPISVFDPELPSAMLSCLAHSLTVWQRAVAWLKPQLIKASQAVDAAGLEDKTAQVDLRAIALEKSLHAALIQQSAIWQDLITGQQTMNAYRVETVMHAVINDLFDRFKQDVQKSLQQTTRGTLEEAFHRIVIPLGVAILIISIPSILWLAIVHPPLSGGLSPNGLWAVLGLGPAIGGMLGIRNLGSLGRGGTVSTTNVTTSVSTPLSMSTTPSGQNVTPGSYLHGLMSNVSATVIEMLQVAMTQVRRDLAALNHEVGITYPLLETFVSSDLHGLSTVNQDYEFMTQVIWNGTERQEEIDNVVRAAFGPLGILIRTQVEKDQSGTGGVPVGC